MTDSASSAHPSGVTLPVRIAIGGGDPLVVAEVTHDGPPWDADLSVADALEQVATEMRRAHVRRIYSEGPAGG